MATANQLVNCKDRVEQILRVSTEAREDDKILWLAYMANNHDLIKKLGTEAFRKLQSAVRERDIPSVETLGRLRRRFQSSGKYLAKNPNRKKHELKVKAALAYLDN